MSRTYRRSKRDAKHSYYHDKAYENYYTTSEFIYIWGNRFSNYANLRSEKHWWENQRAMYHRDGKTDIVGEYAGVNKKGLKRQTKRARRNDEKRYIQKYMKGETDDIPNLEKLYRGHIWDWD